MKSTEFAGELSRLRSTMYGFSRRFTTDREEAWDLVQDTTLKALRYQSKFRNDVNLEGWLFTIMRNTFINQYHHRSKFKKASDEQSQIKYLNTEDVYAANRPDGNINLVDAWKIVEECREELSIPFKMYTSGYKYQEIAEHLGLPLGTIKNRIFQARQEIQKKLIAY